MRHFISLLVIFIATVAYGQHYVVILKEAQVFDAPNANTYKTLNQDGQEVILSSGMAFKYSDSQNGWDKVEYTPGLNGYILHSLEASNTQLAQPKSGKYTCTNSKDKVTITNNNSEWKATSIKGEFDGKEFENVLVFYDRFGNPYYTLVVVNGTPLLMSYDNEVTKFF